VKINKGLDYSLRTGRIKKWCVKLKIKRELMAYYDIKCCVDYQWKDKSEMRILYTKIIM
jgi:hypothetical protein